MPDWESFQAALGANLESTTSAVYRARAAGGRLDDASSAVEAFQAVIRELEPTGVLDLWPEEMAEEAWNRIVVGLRGIRVAANAIAEQGRVTERVSRQITDSAHALDEAVRDFVPAFKTQHERVGAPASVIQVFERISEGIDTRRLLQETRGAHDEVLRVLDVTRQAAGVAGETALSSHFADFARGERRAANVLRLACVVVLIALPALAALLVFRTADNGLSTSEELARLAVGLPLAALAAYLGRESARHREAARWAGELEIKLLTLDAYVEPLPAEHVTSLRSAFGSRIFLSDAERAPTAVDKEGGPSAATDTVRALEEATGLIRAVTAGTASTKAAGNTRSRP